jgi:hypothetical protein
MPKFSDVLIDSPITYPLCDLIVGFVNYEEGWDIPLCSTASILVSLIQSVKIDNLDSRFDEVN